MFYSHCLMSRKGSMKPIWIAAYFHKKLKKGQVSQIDISSSVDEILLQRVTVSYRVLGYLLLGVVRIFSKKVEYLQDDCDQVIEKMKSYVLLKRSNGGKDASSSCITLPEKFELDQFILDLPESFCDKNIVTNQQITLKERFGDPNNGHFSFEKYHEEQDLAHFETNSWDHTPVQGSLSPHSEVNYTMMHCSYLQPSSEVSMEKFLNSQLQQDEYSDTWIGCEDEDSHFDEFDSQVHFAELTPPATGKPCVLNEGDPLADIADGTQKSRLPVNIRAPTPELMANCTPVKEHPRHSMKRKHLLDETLALSNKSMGQSLLDSSTRKEAPNVSKQEKLPNHQDFFKPLIPCTQPETVNYSSVGLHIFDETILLSDEIIKKNLEDTSGLITERRKAPFSALDVWKQSKLLKYQDLSESLIPCDGTPKLVAISTPQKEEPCFSRKRKRLDDDNTVLSNKVMRQNQHDSSDLVAKREQAPVTALDVWKEYKLPQLYWDFLEPLIPCAQELNTLYKRSVEVSHQVEALGSRIVLGEDRLATHREPLEERVLSAEASEGVIRKRNEPSQERDYSPVPSEGGPIRSDNHQSETRKEHSQEGASQEEDIDDDSTSNLVEPPTTSKLDMEVSTTSVPGEDGDQSESECEYVKLALTDEGVLQEDTAETESGWSIRTSSLASLLRKCFENQEHSSREFLNVAPILEGRTRKENARTFYEILVLKSRKFVDVKQDTPYGHIYLVGTSHLMSKFTASKSFL